METIKKGSKGDSVKLLLKYLGLTQDGIFGNNTETAVKAFQIKNKLVSDGIVDSKTWEILQKSTSTTVDNKCIDSSVIYKPLSVHVTKLNNRSIKYLAIHFTAGSNSKPGRALNTYNTFVSRSASADFAVDDRDIVQFNPDIKNYYCWAVGDTKKSSKSGGKYYGKATNSNTISIEICSTCTPATSTAVSKSNHEGWSFTDAALDNAIKIAKIITEKYNIPIENVIRHYDISGKWCPGIIGWNDEVIYTIDGKATKLYNNSNKWIAFKNKLK